MNLAATIVPPSSMIGVIAKGMVMIALKTIIEMLGKMVGDWTADRAPQRFCRKTFRDEFLKKKLAL